MKPFQRSTVGVIDDEHIRVAAEKMACTFDEARDMIIADARETETWVNDIYQVQKRAQGDSGVVHLNIRRRDGRPVLRDWRHFQRIKNELVGPECEGFEIYPAESRLVDTSNKYHLFVFLDHTYRIPFGFSTRDVDYQTSTKPGLRQRPPS